MKTRLKKRGMMKSPTALTSPPSTLVAPKKSVSTECVCRFCLKQMSMLVVIMRRQKKKHMKGLWLYEPRRQSAL